MRSVGLLPLLVAALVPGACASGERAAPTPPTAVNYCQTDADCPEGRCNLGSRRCMANARTEVFFSALPPHGQVSAAAFPTLTAPREIRSGDMVDVNLRAPRTVYGFVRIPDPDDVPDMLNPSRAGRTVLIPATVMFTRANLPEVAAPVQAAAGTMPAPPLAGDPMGHTYSVVVSDGIYDVVVRPSAELAARVPPLYLRGFDVRSDSLLQRFDVLYPRSYSRWSGTVLDRSGRLIPGLTVRAVDLARHGALVSTVATTSGTEPAGNARVGTFAVDISPGATEAWTLRITTDTSTRSWLTVDIPRGALERTGFEARDLRIELPGETGLRDAGSARCHGCVTVRGTVEGRAPSGDRRLIRNAAVILRSPVVMSSLPTEARAWFEAHVQTDAEGAFEASVLPGEYDVLLAPQSQDFANTMRRGFRVRSDLEQQSGQVFEVNPPIAVTGRVITPMRDPVRGARVTAVPFVNAYVRHACLEDPDLAQLAPRASSTETTTGADGSYRLDLDPGLYRVVVEPAEASGFGATLGPALCVASSVSDHDLTLEPPVEVRGVVRDAMHDALPGATVEGIIRVREPGAEGVVVRVGRSTAGRDGSFTLLLPGGAMTGR